MNTILETGRFREEAACPKCGNTRELRGAASARTSGRAYDVMSDTYGLMSCPACGWRAAWAEFHKEPEHKQQ